MRLDVHREAVEFYFDPPNQLCSWPTRVQDGLHELRMAYMSLGLNTEDLMDQLKDTMLIKSFVVRELVCFSSVQ